MSFYGVSYWENDDVVTRMKERREAKEKHEAKVRAENTKDLEKMAASVRTECASLPDLLAARSEIGKFKYYRNCMDLYDTSVIDNLLYNLQKQEKLVSSKIEKINNGSEDENTSVRLYNNVRRDFLA